MTKATVYKVPKSYHSDPVFKYRYTEQMRVLHVLKDLPEDFKAMGFETENDLIINWTDFAKSACEGEYAETTLPCWEGHYEQFGRLMLEIADLSDKRVSRAGYPAAIIDALLPERHGCLNGFWQVSGAEEREWYRAWFSFIGHPHFQRFEATTGIAESAFRDKKYLLGIALESVTRSLNNFYD